jgi:Na+-driven multidrug efflux pump
LAIGVNAAGNYALVFGHWGAPALGLSGSGIASVITACATLLAYALVILATAACAAIAFWAIGGAAKPRACWRSCAGPADLLHRAGRGRAVRRRGLPDGPHR